MSLFNRNQFPPRESVALPSVTGVVNLLAHARDKGLKFPKLWLQFANRDPLRIHVAGERSSTPGYLMLTDGAGFPDNQYYGRIAPTGALEIGRDGHARKHELVPLLERLACEPAKVAAEYGHMTGNCCFCSRGLNDARSTEVGYGPVCAEKFGLPWGETKGGKLI